LKKFGNLGINNMDIILDHTSQNQQLNHSNS